MILPLLYEVGLWLMAILALPKFLYALIWQKKYRSSFSKKIWFNFPEIDAQGRAVIWVHAVSMGETKAVAALAKQFKQKNESAIMIISSATETGHAEAKRSIPEADHFVYMPFDFYWNIKSILKRIKPTLVVLCETDFWYNFLRLCKKNQAYITLVNGKISERSTKRFSQVSWFAKQLFSNIDNFCMQNQLYADRFMQIGVPPQKINVTGNLKFDSPPVQISEEEKQVFKAQLGIESGDQVIVIGSSHNPEEKQLIEAIKRIWRQDTRIKVVLVPRHPERFDDVENILKDLDVPYRRYTTQKTPLPSNAVIFLDTMGLLGKCYQVANIAIVAGSYATHVGGHNILEPLWFGVPAVYGPYMFGQPELVEVVNTYSAGLQIPLESLSEKLESLLQNNQEAVALREGAFKLISSMRGATNKTFNAIHQYKQDTNFTG